MILNDDQLNAQLLLDFKSIIDEVAYKLLLRLQEIIEREVYDAGSPNWYQRHKMIGGLLGSFEKSDTTISGQSVESEISQNNMSMELDEDNFVHGSNFWSVANDIRDFLSEIIIEGKSGPLFGDGFFREPRDFWKPFLELFSNGEADNLIEKAMTQRGMVWKKF
jgi:hypothetical protein